MHLLRFRAFVVAGAIAALMGGCENGATLGPPFQPKPEDLIGVWKFVSGLNAITSIPGVPVSYEVQYLEIQTGQKARLYCKSFYDVVAEFPVDYVVLDSTIVIESESDAFNPIAIIFDMSDVDSLATTDASEKRSEFVREESVPADASCRPLYIVNQIYALPAIPHVKSGLVPQFGGLWFRESRVNTTTPLFKIDPNTAATTAFNTHQDSDYVQTSHGDGLWFTCNCGDNSYMARRDENDLPVDDLDLVWDLGKKLDISSLAYDSPKKYLWASGFGVTPLGGVSQELLAIDIDGIDGIVETFSLQSMEGLEFDGKWLWGIARSAGVLVKIDPDTGKPVLSYLIPNGGQMILWSDVAFVDGRLFLVGENTTFDQGAFVELSFQRPSPVIDPGGVGGVGL